MDVQNYIGVVYDGLTVGGSHMYRVNYGTFAIGVESPTALTIDEARYIADARLGSSTEQAVPPPVSVTNSTTFTKLQIRRAMRRLGIEGQLDALLSASALFEHDWADSLEIDLEDTVTSEALASASIDVAAVIAEILRA